MQMPAPLLCYRPSSCKMKAAGKYVWLNKYTTGEEQIQMGPTLPIPLHGLLPAEDNKTYNYLADDEIWLNIPYSRFSHTTG